MANIVFMGTPAYAVPSVKALREAGHHISLLMCQPDKKKGRGHKMQFPATKEYAVEHGIEVFQPYKLKSEEVAKKLASVQADFFVVIAYGRILPKSILDLPRFGCINLHGSILPKWRGAAPIQFSLIHGDKETGVCSMLMDEGLDTGDILLCETTPIAPNETATELGLRLSEISAKLAVKTIAEFESITVRKQDESEATFTRLIDKRDRIINWESDARNIFNLYRGLTPNPGTYTWFRGKRLQLKSLELVDADQVEQIGAGHVCGVDEKGILVACQKGVIRILECQPENKRKMGALDLANGHQIKAGEKLG